jgi:hypothetical protein
MLILAIILLFHFCSLRPSPRQCWRTRAKKRLDPFDKINIDEGGGGKIQQKIAFLMRFASGSIAPMFYWILPTPKRTNP